MLSLANVNARISDVVFWGCKNMARDLSSTSRIFSRRSSRAARIFSAFLLTLSLLATLTGLATAVYLERARDAAEATPLAETTSPAATPIVQTAVATTDAAPVVAPSKPHDPMAAAAAIPAPPSIEPSAGAATPIAAPARRTESPERETAASSPPTIVAAPAPHVARLEVTPEPPARAVTQSPAATVDAHEAAASPATTVTTPYWVEYGVYQNARAAKRLQQALADQGLRTVIAPTHTPDGRPLLRVRSAAELDYDAAKAASENVRQTLKLSTLIHRGMPGREEERAPAVATQASSPVASASRSYWVQFGAFLHRPQAERLQQQLAQGGIETAVSPMRGTSGRTLYWVRSLNLPDHDSALAVAGRGKEAGGTDFLVGQSVLRSGAAAEPNRTEDEVVRPGARYHTAESLPFPAR